MHTIHVEHLGALHNRATRYDNQSSVASDAPAGSGGKGEHFSPLDYFAAALAFCCLTQMAKKAATQGIDNLSVSADVGKNMANDPLRVSEIIIDFHLSRTLDADTRSIIEAAARHCPVANSLSAELKQTMRFHYDA